MQFLCVYESSCRAVGSQRPPERLAQHAAPNSVHVRATAWTRAHDLGVYASGVPRELERSLWYRGAKVPEFRQVRGCSAPARCSRQTFRHTACAASARRCGASCAWRARSTGSVSGWGAWRWLTTHANGVISARSRSCLFFSFSAPRQASPGGVVTRKLRIIPMSSCSRMWQ